MPNFILYVISFVGCLYVAITNVVYPPLLHLRCLYNFCLASERRSKRYTIVTDVIIFCIGLVVASFTSVLNLKVWRSRKDGTEGGAFWLVRAHLLMGKYDNTRKDLELAFNKASRTRNGDKWPSLNRSVENKEMARKNKARQMKAIISLVLEKKCIIYPKRIKTSGNIFNHPPYEYKE